MKEETKDKPNDDAPKRVKRKVLVRKVIVDGKVVRTEVVEPGSQEYKKAISKKGPTDPNDPNDPTDPTKKEMSKKQPKKRASSKSKNKRLIWIIAINCIVLGILGGAAFVAAHFLLQWGTRHGIRATVPNFQSLTMEQAEAVAVEGDLHLIINDSIYVPTRKRGAILDQIPQEGTIVKPGRAIYLTINATQNKMVDVPYVAGRSLRQAKSMLEVASLTIKELIYEEDIATNYILAQYCNGEEITEKSNRRASVGTGVTLKVGVDKGHNETITPMLIGKALYVAKSELWDAGLNVGEIDSEEIIGTSEEKLAWVISQSQPSDSLLTLGTKIDLKLSLQRSLVDTVLFRRERDRVEGEKLLLREKEIADSLALTMVDSTAVEKSKPRAKKVEFEDLFN